MNIRVEHHESILCIHGAAHILFSYLFLCFVLDHVVCHFDNLLDVRRQAEYLLAAFSVQVLMLLVDVTAELLVRLTLALLFKLLQHEHATAWHVCHV